MENVLVSFKNALLQKRVRTVLIGLYVLVIIGLSATARAEDSNWGIFPHPPKQTMSVSQQQTQQFIGEMVATIDGRFFLVNGDASYELRSTEDLTQFDGYVVAVTGTEIKHKVGPVYQLMSTTPLQVEESGLTAAPMVIVQHVSIIQ